MDYMIIVFKKLGAYMSYENIIVEKSDGIITVSLNRPDALNALNDQLMDELLLEVDNYEKDVSLRCMILTGSEKAFAAGADIKQMQPKTYMDVYKEDFITRNWERVASCRKPIIAAVSGYALGGGCELAMMCDIIIANEEAKFGQPEINIGAIPGAGGTQRLTRSIGKSKAMLAVLTGEMITAEEAENCGLVAKVFKSDDFDASLKDIALKIANQSKPLAKLAKQAVNVAYETTLEEGIRSERALFYSTFALEDHVEGMQAFSDKRKPIWKNK